MTRPVATWHILTGKYPPHPGGIADYTAMVATGLASAGDAVHAWTSPAEAEALPTPGVVVHRVPRPWSYRGLAAIGRGLNTEPGPHRIVVQYAPNEFEYQGMNLQFCRWLLGRGKRGDDVRVMFHEVRYHPVPGDGLARWAMVAVQTAMARMLIQASTRLYVSVPGWADLIRAIARHEVPPIVWLPVPSNIPAIDDPEGVAAIRRQVTPGGEMMIGTFGTYGESTAAPLIAAFAGLLVGRPGRVGLLVGRNSQAFAARLVDALPELAARVVATGGINASDVSRHLQACDLLIQPVLGGVCTKQTTTMAGLANGCAIVAGAGRLTEPVWSDEGCVALAASTNAGEFVPIAESLLANVEERARLGVLARSVYDRRFSVARTVEAMRRMDVGP